MRDTERDRERETKVEVNEMRMKEEAC